MDKTGFIKVYAISWIMGLFLSNIFVLIKLPIKTWNKKATYDLPRWLTLSAAYTINSFSLILGNNVGLILLGMYSFDGRLAGVYAAIHNIVNFIFLILTASNRYFLPWLSSVYARNDAASFQHILTQRIRFLGVVCLIFILLILSLGYYFLSLYGVFFTHFYWVLLILALAMCVETLLGISVNLIVFFGSEHRAAVTQIISVSIAVILSVILIPYVGIYGALIGYVIPKIMISSYNSYWLYRKHRVNVIAFL